MLSKILDLPPNTNIEEFVSYDDLDKMSSNAVELYSDRINYLAYSIYGSSAVGKKSFFEEAKETLSEALEVFVFEKQHWRSNRDINSYLLAALKYKAQALRNSSQSVKYRSVKICPGCKFLGSKEYLIEDGDKLHCSQCKESLESNTIDYSEKRVREAFVNHSSVGFICPECKNFLPKSLIKNDNITCVYTDCVFTGSTSKLQLKYHPRSKRVHQDVSINSPIVNDSSCETSIQDLQKAETINADVVLEVDNQISDEFMVLSSVIDEQVKLVKKMNSSSTMMQKLLMYEAYGEILKKYPREAFAYLVHRKCIAEHSIQASVFQEYVKLVEDSLPCTVVSSGKSFEIVSLTDPMLLLFSGVSEYSTVVKYDGSIPNETLEHYFGSRNLTDYGPSFIGKIINLTGAGGENYLDKIERYDFNLIQTRDIKPGTLVTVKHYRMPSHYEIGALAYLQRTRKKIVDKVFLKLNGTKREARE